MKITLLFGCLSVIGFSCTSKTEVIDTNRPPNPNNNNGGGSQESVSITSVSIDADTTTLDGVATCSAQASSSDGSTVSLAYKWKNQSTEQVIYSGNEIWMSAAYADVGDVIECVVSATTSTGLSAQKSATVDTVCGFSQLSNMESVNIDLHLVFRPYITDELIWLYGDEPWDFGYIPDWIYDLMDEIQGWVDLLGLLTGSTAQVDALYDILDLLNYMETAYPELTEGSKPPDVDIEPYLVDNNYNVTFISGGGLWENTNDVQLSFSAIDLTKYYLQIDIEDIDATFDDNMGDWFDHGFETPFALGGQLLADTGYCKTMYYNKSDTGRYTGGANIPSSILMFELEVY
jgi:hypothetical protein